VDGRTLEDDTVTVRFRDTKEQIRVPISELIPTLKRLMRREGVDRESGAGAGI